MIICTTIHVASNGIISFLWLSNIPLVCACAYVSDGKIIHSGFIGTMIDNEVVELGGEIGTS